MEIIDFLLSKFGKIEFKDFDELLDLNLKIKQNEIFEIEESGKLIVIGDLHGDFDSLINILQNSNALSSKKTKFLFLGDYGDRGYYQVEVYYSILFLKKELKDKVILLRGNHEYLQNLEVYPHDLPRQLLAKFGDKANEIYKKIKEFWENLSYCAYSKKYFFVHGGIPINLDFKNLSLQTKIQLLWNDPIEEKGYQNSYRGAGYLFGYDITNEFLKKYNFELIIRSHEPCNAFKENHFGKVLTVFSMKGFYGNKKIGYIKIDFDKNKFEKIVL